MEKILFRILAVTGILLIVTPVSAMGEILTTFDEDSAIYEEVNYGPQEKKPYTLYEKRADDAVKPVAVQKRNLFRNKLQQNKGMPTADIPRKTFAKLRGIWGLAGDNELDGYFGGRLIKNPRVIVFQGVYNKTDNKSYGKVIGIMKHGYFNGRLITLSGKKCRIVGLYQLDQENKTLKLRWLTPYKAGWAIAKILTL